MITRVGDVEEVRWVVRAVMMGVNGEPVDEVDGERYFGGWFDRGIASRLVRSNTWQNG
jgi:hypothetical protein